MNKGERAITIDEVPLDWCFQPGVKLDFRDKPDGHVITAREVQDELLRIGHELAAARDRRRQHARRLALRQRRLREFGLRHGLRRHHVPAREGHSPHRHRRLEWDAPFFFTAQKWAKDHDPSIIWEGHKAGRDIGYCHLEKLHNLEALPGDGFTIACFPHKIRGASAGWTRAVAIFEE